MVASLFFVVPVRAAQYDPNARLSEAFTAIDEAVAASSVPGMVVGITDRKETQKVIVHGFSDLKRKTALTPDSLFAIGSISKSFTAIALMQLLDEGRFDPRAPITRYLPWFKVNSTFAPITGHHLLSHTAGLPNYFADLASSRFAAYALREFQPSYAPGAHYWYSNTGFQILGYVLESVEHAPYHTLIERRVLQPLGMTASFAVIDDSQRAAMPVSYVRWPYDDTYVEAPWFEYSAADGSILSTAADMCAYTRFILNRGTTTHGRLLTEKSFERLTTPVLENYAYGLRVQQSDGDTFIGHGGSIAGFNSSITADMNDGFAVVFLSNGGLDPALDQWVVSVLKAAYRGQPFGDPPPRQPATQTLTLSQYVGTYRAADGHAIEFVAAGSGVALRQGNAIVPLTPMGTDTFRTPTNDSNLFPFIFGRTAGHADAKVAEVSHGAEWYANDAYAGAKSNTTPPEYLAYVGHYENHSPEGPEARIFVRNGRLMALVEGEVPETSNHALDPVRQGVFRPAEPRYNPERYRFDTIVEGHALRLIISGTPLYRVETQ
jgi:CubicO group peptidase (beta-lactamase class C family)